MYKLFIKAVLFIIITIYLVILFPVNVNADLINPDFLIKKCALGEKEIKCRYSSKEPFGPRTLNTCKKYENNPNYYLLATSGSSFGGKEKYCLKVGAQENIDYIFIGGFIVIIISTSLIALFLIRKRNASK